MTLSNCCDALPAGNNEDYGICSKCNEHCDFYVEVEEMLAQEWRTDEDDNDDISDPSLSQF